MRHDACSPWGLEMLVACCWRKSRTAKNVVPVWHWAFRVFAFAQQVKQYPVTTGIVYVHAYILTLYNIAHTQTHAHTDAPPHLQLIRYHFDRHHSQGHCLIEAALLAH